jgi:hypothetical protein
MLASSAPSATRAVNMPTSSGIAATLPHVRRANSSTMSSAEHDNAGDGHGWICAAGARQHRHRPIEIEVIAAPVASQINVVSSGGTTSTMKPRDRTVLTIASST